MGRWENGLGSWMDGWTMIGGWVDGLVEEREGERVIWKDGCVDGGTDGRESEQAGI